MRIIPKCPYCGESYYAENYSTTTAMGWTPIFKNGALINDNPNTTTTYCTCCNCSHDFHYVTQYGEVQSITDDGKKPKVPVLKVPLTYDNEVNTYETKIPMDQLLAPSSNFENGITLATDEDLAELKQQVKELCKEVKELKKEIWATHHKGE